MILTKLEKKDFEKILSNYDLGNYISNKHVPIALQNTVYFITTTKGKYVMKIFESETLNYIKFQIKLMDHLHKKRMPVQEIYKTKKKSPYLTLNKKFIIIHEFIKGINPKKYSNQLIKDMSKTLAKINKELLKIPLENKIVWKKDHQFKIINIKYPLFKNFNLIKENKKILIQIKNIDRKKLRRCAIHGDYHLVNLLTEKDKVVSVIDWGDSHEDYLCQELTAPILDNFLEDYLNFNQIKQITKEYQKILPLNKEEIKSIYYFIKVRFLGGIDWHIKMSKLHPDNKTKLEKEAKRWIKKYHKFNEIELNKFLELF